MRTGIYPGTFDPITFGHFDIIQRATRLVDRLVIGVARHSGKDAAFTVEERIGFIAAHVKRTGAEAEILIYPMEGLLIDFVRQCHATVIFRGLRAVADFDYEFQMAMMNARLAPEIETVFLMASETNQFIASRLVKEVARLGGDITTFVPPEVAAALQGRAGALVSS
jgi:pantetheine-phosphate adenylyltransferase